MTDIVHRTVDANGIKIHYAEAGAGPLVILCHGWPESWYSWRHQLSALAEAGYRAVAPDMRGYGQTDRPEQVEKYTMLHLVGDMVGLLDALGGGQAVIAGHDWGAPVAWNSALLRPDRFRAVIGTQRSLHTTQTATSDLHDAADRRRPVLSALFSAGRAGRGGIRTRSRRDASHAALRHVRGRAAAKRRRADRYGSAKGRLPRGPRAACDAAAVAVGSRYRLLRQRIRVHRVSRRPQLVSQYRPPVG